MSRVWDLGSPQPTPNENPALPFVIPSEAEGSAVSLNPKPVLAAEKSLYEGHGFSRVAGIAIKRALAPEVLQFGQPRKGL
jgi:hypothetical protein